MLLVSPIFRVYRPVVPSLGSGSARLAGFLRAAPSAYHWVIGFCDPQWLCAEVYVILRSYTAALGQSRLTLKRLYAKIYDKLMGLIVVPM
jgi:hypothetical protein